MIPDEDSFAKTSNGIANHILACLITIFPIIIIIISRYMTHIISYTVKTLEQEPGFQEPVLKAKNCQSGPFIHRVRKYAKIVQMTPLRSQRESLQLKKFLVTNREPLRLQKFSVTNTVLSLPFSQQIQLTLIVNVVNLN